MNIPYFRKKQCLDLLVYLIGLVTASGHKFGSVSGKS